MTFDPDAAYQAILARDARFDGRLFVGVTSTGVYCRPICRVRTPMKKNCRFFATAAQAEAATFRPCMKCRPEIAPGAGLPWTVMDSSRTLARQAGFALDADAAEGEAPSVAALAERLGVSDRHLRRIFVAEHGVTPLQYAQTRRLLLAKQLLTDTKLPVAQVALTSGFRSLRRFNAAFADSYRMNPARLRRVAVGAEREPADEVAVTVTLGYRAPYDVGSLLRFIEQRAIPGVESVEALGIRRSVRAGTLAAAPGWIEATFVPAAAQVRLRFAPALAPASGRIVGAARRWLDLDAAPEAIDATLAELPGAPGLRLPGSLDAFELAVRAVLGQQVTVAGARTLARRLAERFGAPVATPWPGDRPRVPGAGGPRGGAGRGDRRARHHPRARRRDRRDRRSVADVRRAAAAAQRPGAADRAALRAARHRPVDGALHRDARARLARRLSAERRRGAEGDAPAVRHRLDARGARARRGLAPVARVRGAAPLEHPGENDMTYATDSIRTACTAQMIFDTPLGPLLLARTAKGLAGAWFEGQRHHPPALAAAHTRDDALLTRVAEQLHAYFDGAAAAFDLPLDLQARRSSARCGRRCSRSAAARRAATATSRARSGARSRCARSARRSAATRCRSSCRATA